MKRSITVLAAILLLTFGGSAYSEANGDGNELLHACKLTLDDNVTKEKNIYNGYMLYGYCLGILQAVADTNSSLFEEMGKRLFCFPSNGIKNKQSVKIVVKYLEEHPEKLHLHNTDLVISAYREAFPCK